MLKSAARARSEVGRAPSGTTSRLPFHRPAMIRTEGLLLFKDRSLVRRRELEPQLVEPLELAVWLSDPFQLHHSFFRDQLLHAKHRAVEPLQERSRGEVLGREPRGGRE